MGRLKLLLKIPDQKSVEKSSLLHMIYRSYCFPGSILLLYLINCIRSRAIVGYEYWHIIMHVLLVFYSLDFSKLLFFCKFRVSCY